MGKLKQTKLEKKFEEECIRTLRQLPKSFWPEKLESNCIRGVPDRIGCVNGHFVALEFKRTKEDIHSSRAKLQGYILDMIEESGGFAAFVFPENWFIVYDELKDLLREIK